MGAGIPGGDINPPGMPFFCAEKAVHVFPVQGDVFPRRQRLRQIHTVHGRYNKSVLYESDQSYNV